MALARKKCMILLHDIVAHYGMPLSKTIVKAHILTGGDCMRKIGTKHAAIVSDPVQYLTSFGENSIMTDQDRDLAEWYLVRVWAGAVYIRCARGRKLYNWQSRNWQPFTHKHMWFEFIHRAALLAHQACHLLTVAMDRERGLEPLEHGWEEHYEMLLPSQGLMA